MNTMKVRCVYTYMACLQLAKLQSALLYMQLVRHSSYSLPSVCSMLAKQCSVDAAAEQRATAMHCTWEASRSLV